MISMTFFAQGMDQRFNAIESKNWGDFNNATKNGKIEQYSVSVAHEIYVYRKDGDFVNEYNERCDKHYTAEPPFIITASFQTDRSTATLKGKIIKGSESFHPFSDRKPAPIDLYLTQNPIACATPKITIDECVEQEKAQQNDERKQLETFHYFLNNN